MWLGCLLSVNVVYIICVLSFLDTFASVSERMVLAKKPSGCALYVAGGVWGILMDNLSLLACTIAGGKQGATRH